MRHRRKPLLTFALICFLLLLIRPTYTAAQVSKEEKKRIDEVEKTSDQAKLLHIVTSDSSDQVRVRAVRRITDQLSLAVIAKSDLDVRYEALDRLTDQALLTDVALNGKDTNVTSKAVQKITDQLLLAKVAKTLKYAGYVGGAAAKYAVDRITDADVLLDVAQNAVDFFIRGEAIKKLPAEMAAARQEIIGRIALTDKNSSTRERAVERLTDQALLAKIAQTDPDKNVRRTATKQLNDPSVLATVAAKDADKFVRETAVERINDTAILERIVQDDASERVRESALKKLSDPVILSRVAQNNSNPRVRAYSVERLTDKALLAAIAQKDSDAYVRVAAVKKIDDKELIAKIGQADSRSIVRMTAVDKINDPKVLAAIAAKDDDAFTALAALKKLTDQSLIADVARRSANAEVRFAALERLEDAALISEIAAADPDLKLKQRVQDMPVRILGRLIDASTKRPLQNWTVRLAPYPAEGEDAQTFLRRIAPNSWQLPGDTSNQDGEFEIYLRPKDAHPAGAYTFGLSHRGGPLQLSAPLPRITVTETKKRVVLGDINVSVTP